MKPSAKTIGDYTHQVTKARQAEQLLENELFIELIKKIEVAAVDKLLNSDDEKTRNELWHRVQAIRSINKELELMIAGGKIAQQKLERAKDEE